MVLPLFVSDVPLHCINESAYEYHVPAKLIIAVLNVERGRAGVAHRNKNGTYDLGPMQINTSWWPRLYSYGITPQQVLYDPCKNVEVGTWILANSITDNKDLLFGIGAYHSRTIFFNRLYTQSVRIVYTKLQGLVG